MDENLKQFIDFLERDIREWEEAAQFYEQHIHSVTTSGESERRSGKEEAEKYRARVSERRELIEQLKKQK